MVVLLLESHQTHVPFLWRYLVGLPPSILIKRFESLGRQLRIAQQRCLFPPSVHELAPAGHVAHFVREVLKLKRDIAAIPAMALAKPMLNEDVQDLAFAVHGARRTTVCR